MVGVFFVRKKYGSLRMILDARRKDRRLRVLSRVEMTENDLMWLIATGDKKLFCLPGVTGCCL